MNAHLFRLVYSRHVGMYVPVHEAAHACGRGGRTGVATVVLATLLAAPPVLAQLPVPCAGGACGMNPNPTAFVAHGAAGYAVNGSSGIVTQTTPKAILNWQSYNIGAGHTLTYRFQDAAGNLPAGASFATLNRIWQGSPSEIAGRIQVQPGQNGQITLINRNGILFKDGAQVSVGSLVASTLDITNELFLNGIQSNLAADTVPAFLGEGGGVVRGEAGAELRTETGGRVMLLAENVENHGVIQTPEGQTILAAGSKVYLAVSDDPRLRGFLVEVDNGGTAANTGRILAERGNVSMTGLTVNQSGRVTATTSVNLNGSIRLMARDTVTSYTDPTRADARAVPLGSRTGSLAFTPDSVTEVLPETASSATLLDEQTFNRSLIEGVGRTVHVQGGSLLSARGGDIALAAQAGGLFQNPGDPRVPDARLQVDAGAVLDTSGLRDVPIPVERNYIQVELRGDELKDAPLQRDSFLRGSTVWIDIEQGTPLADVSGYIAKVGRTVAERSTVGGAVTLRSEGELVLNAGARLDVSGGSIAYQAGYGRTTQLVANGSIVDIGNARPDVRYDGFADRYSVADAKWGQTRTWDLGRKVFIPAYVAGRDAGRLSLSAHGLVLDADLHGGAVYGERQRTRLPQGGLLQVTGLAGSGTAADQLQDFRFAATHTPYTLGMGDPLTAAQARTLVLAAETLRTSGFRRLSLSSEGRIDLPAGAVLDVGDAGSVSLTGRGMQIDGGIRAAGGSITLTTREGRGEQSLDAGTYALVLGSTAHLDVAGRWVNDLPGSGVRAGVGTYTLNGGSIRLVSHSNLDLAPGSVLDASAGARVAADARVSYGKPGSINLASGRFGPLSEADPLTAAIRLGGELRAYGFDQGGRLTLTTSSLHMGPGAAGVPGELVLDETIFGQGGFQDYELVGIDGVKVAAGFRLEPSPRLRQLDAVYRLRSSGAALEGFTSLVQPAERLRPPTRVALGAENFYRGDVRVDAGALLRVTPQGEISLTAKNRLTVLGSLEAPAGRITLRQTLLLDGEEDINNFDPGRAVFLGAGSRLLATGHDLATPDAQGLRKGRVLDGGEVVVEAGKGYLVLQKGAVIDVSGTHTTLDLSTQKGLEAVYVASDGGGIALTAREGMLLEGELRAHAGGALATGGRLSLTLRRDKDWKPVGGAALPPELQQQRRIILQAMPTEMTASLEPGAALDSATLNGLARLASGQVAQGGFADLSLDAQHRIGLAGDLGLDLSGRLTLAAPNLEGVGGAQARIDAAALLLGPGRADAQGETLRNDASGGAGRLALSADLIEVVGHTSVQGFGLVELASRGDLRLRGVVYNASLSPLLEEAEYVYRGGLATGGDLSLAARQVYPVSMAEFALEVHNNPGGRISVASTGADTPVLSAGGRLRLTAPHIDQAGALKAPFGELHLVSARIDRVTNSFGANGLPTGQNPVSLTRAAVVDGEIALMPGSLTSVSAEGQVIPLGRTELSGRDWVYDYGMFKRVLGAPPERRIVLDADRVEVNAGARLDLSGGGDLLAYEFLRGPGGSRDILLPENNAGLYAVLPAAGMTHAPYDAQTLIGLQDWQTGAAVRLLEDAGGLKAGTYALLPARYALLPGAWLVRVAGIDTDAVPRGGSTLATGYTRVAGHLGRITAGGAIAHGARTATLDIAPGRLARDYSEYLVSRASTHYAALAGAQQTADAGRLAIAVGGHLTLAGELTATWGSGARGPEVDIAALRLAVTPDGADYAAGYVSLSAGQLADFGAASLLLGGMRSLDTATGRLNLDQRSEQVIIAADVSLAAPELILAAREQVGVEAGAALAGSGASTGAARDLYVTDALGDGAGALLRLAAGAQSGLTRAPVGAARGVLEVAGGATLRADGSMILDATLDNRTRGEVILPADGGALSIGARRIRLAEDGLSVPTDALVFDQDRLAALGHPAHLRLRSYTTVDLHGQVSLGGGDLESLVIEAAGLAGHATDGQTARLEARQLTLANPDGIDPATAFVGGIGQGDLEIGARTLTLGPGRVTLHGFDETRLTAAQRLLGQGGELRVASAGAAAGDLRIEAGRVTVAAGADQIIRADGQLVTAASAAPVTAGPAPLGGRLEFVAQSILHGGRIVLPAGDVFLRGQDGITLAAGSVIDVGGVSLPFADILAHAPGGRVSLESTTGDVLALAGSRIAVGGSGLGGHAGELMVRAGGDAVLAGSLTGDAAAGYHTGRFRLDARRLNPDDLGRNDYAALNALLESGGFHQSRRIRVRLGDLDLAAGVTSRAAEIELAADDGDIAVAGTLDASGARGGRIGLFAGGNLDLLDGARLLAYATEARDTAWGTAGEGGTVALGSGETGQLGLAAGSLIDVSVPAGSAARAGRVLLRAVRTATGAALAGLEGKVVGAERVELEAYRVYAGVTELIAGTTSGTRLGLSSLHAHNNAYLAAVDVAALKGGLDTGGAGFFLRPGVEVRATGNLTLSQDWNLNPLRYGGEAGVLTLRAAGDLRLNANLSDGFSTATSAGLLQTSTRGWSYRLVAGADPSAADPRATAAVGDVVVAAGKLVRTGPSAIEVSAAGDVILQKDAAIYTAGYATPALTGFTITGLTGVAFPTGGGDLTLRAGGSVVATNGPSGLVTDWLWRQGNINAPSSALFRTPGWWPQIDQFKNGVAALGGGDVSIESGGRVANLLAATVTNARQPATHGTPVDISQQLIQGGGDLLVRAGGAIEGGVFFADRGEAHIATRAAVVAGMARGNQTVATVLALGDGRAEIAARQSLSLAAVVNPGLVPQVVTGNLGGTGGQNRESYFVTYGPGSGARLLSIAGNLELVNDREHLRNAFALVDDKFSGLALYPAVLEATALSGDLAIRQGYTQMPSALGDLRLLAAGHVLKAGNEPIHLSDAALGSMPILSAPSRTIDAVNRLVTLPERESDSHGPERLYAEAALPVYIVTRDGDIIGQPSPYVFAVLAKAAIIEAGRDILDVTLVGQNMRPTDVTRLQAGRDIRFDIVRDPIFGKINQISAARIAIGGPGRLELIAGGDIDLGVAQGVVTRGNLANPYLPEGGADLLAVAGARARGATGAVLPVDPRLFDPVAIGNFFAELARSAEEGAASGDYSRGQAAIADIFPAGSETAPLTYHGDINLFFSQFKTEQGGGIRLLAPGGLVNAGLASLSEFSRAAADLGIMTVQGGEILAYTRGDFQVNSSRVFTISGGDILLWSAEGNIDAGKGAKTASATPPPRLRIDKDGNFVLDVSQSIAGSGIGALKAGSNVSLVAPKGEVNAGDAGIRAGGNLTIAAERVVGADNIQVGGVSTGVPVADTSSLGASLGGLGNVGDAGKATQEVTQSVSATAKDSEQTAEQTRQTLASFRPSFISVEVLGFGESGSIQDEAERRRRQEEERQRSGGA
jgi:filamentous hemagglutinin